MKISKARRIGAAANGEFQAEHRLQGPGKTWGVAWMALPRLRHRVNFMAQNGLERPVLPRLT